MAAILLKHCAQPKDEYHVINTNYSAQTICIIQQCRPLAGLLRLDEALVNSFWLKSKQNYVKLVNIDQLFSSIHHWMQVGFWVDCGGSKIII